MLTFIVLYFFFCVLSLKMYEVGMDILLILQVQDYLSAMIRERDFVYKVGINIKLCDTCRKIKLLSNTTTI